VILCELNTVYSIIVPYLCWWMSTACS